jgi:hypothetical protein
MQLLELNREGFIPGPGETEEQFLARVERSKKFFDEGSWIPKPHWDWVDQSLQEIFDFSPRYVPVFYSNRDLRLWQGAAAWSDGTVQLREGFRKGSYLGYAREEVLAHEAVHIARAAFQESRYEEFFAYLTSEKKWRRVLGPIVRRPWEVWPLMVAAVLGLWQVSALWAGLGFIRLIRCHLRLRAASKQFDPKWAKAILLRLTDDEIDLFAKGEDVEKYAFRQNCIRWKLIKLGYLDHGKKN